MTAAVPALDFSPMTDGEREAAASAKPTAKPDKVPVVPVPADAPLMRYRHPRHGASTGVWAHRDAQGRLHHYRARFDFVDENGEPGKEVVPVSYCALADGRRAWRQKAPPPPWPLYHLPELLARPDAPVLVVEGEKKVEPAEKFFSEYVAVTSPGGAGAAGKADWTPLRGRRVVVWPDADDPAKRGGKNPGEDYARDVCRLAHEAGAVSVVMVPVPEELRRFKDGWDLADAPPEGWTPERLRALLEAAKPREPEMTPFNTVQKTPNVGTEPAPEPNADGAKRKEGERLTQVKRLIALADAADLFHTRDGNAHADVVVVQHRETWPVRSRGFRRWITRRFFEEAGGAPNSEAMNAALNVIEARAHFGAPQRQVHVRVAGDAGRVYLDLVDDEWRAVEVDADGWRIVERPPVRFRRTPGMLPLPAPERGGSVATLRKFLNVTTEADFALAVAWLLAALRDKGPYPVLALAGEQGSAKSTFSAILRALVDPNSAPLRALPREDRDLFIAATNGHVLAFDNVSGLPSWISDTLCRLATGGGFAVRQLYSDQDEVLFDATRPVILNGIDDAVTRPDLADRAIVLTLEPIADDRRRPERELLADFERERPRILGALLDAVVHGLRELPRVRLDRLPRMADFAIWATACEGALWPAGTFMTAYAGNREEAVESVLAADPVAEAVRELMGDKTIWNGTASDLLGALGEKTAEVVRKNKNWPATANVLSRRLRRAATFLRKVGIGVNCTRQGRGGSRMIHLSREETDKRGEISSAPSVPSVRDAKPLAGQASGRGAADDRVTQTDGRDEPTVSSNSLDFEAADGADGTDAKFPPLSAPAAELEDGAV